MRNLLYAFLVTLAVSSHLSANDYDILIGVEGGYSWADFETLDVTTQNGELSNYGLKLGLSDDESRMYLVYNYVDAFSESTTTTGEYQTLTFNAEAFTDTVSIFGFMDLALFVGGHLGAVNINAQAGTSDTSEYGFLYGGQTGLMFTFGIPISFELGYRFSGSDLDIDDSGTNLETYQNTYLGLNLVF